MSDLILHKRSVVVNDGIPKLPTPDQLAYGELAINFADGHETLTIRNSADKIAEFKSKEYFENIIIENELVTAEALNELNERITYFEDIDNENELATLADLDDLNKRFTSFEENFDNNELVTAAALNDLNKRIASLAQEITYDELVVLRNKGQLSPGHFYRITDYVTTTLATDTLSHGKPFDIIVLATDVDVLNENAKAIQREGDTYFKNCKLSAWKLKYSLDNDTTRFEWADKTNGKGVIYYMADEWGNECPYDFKNITFRHPNNSADTAYYFTFTNRTTSAVSATDKSITYGYCYGNVIKNYVEYNRMKLNKIIFITNPTTFCNSNSFGNDCYKNSFGNDCKNNSFGNYCQNNSFGTYCQHNSLGNNCSSNSFGNYCSANSLGNNCSSNSFGNNCSNNSFGNNCRVNSFGNNCVGNSFGNYCYYNSFRLSASTSGTVKDYCYYNHFDDGCCYNIIWNADTTSGSVKLQNINVNRGVVGRYDAYNYINVETLNSEHEINVNQIDGIASVGDILSIRYATLKNLRDNSQLITGQQYRITDYMTTTAQFGTLSAGHPFDVIVLALSKNALAEEAYAVHSERDTEGYFANSNLSAWKIWYSLDNDTTKFAWADAENGKGVIYRMIDEFNNDIPYDFKNIMYEDKKGFGYFQWGNNYAFMRNESLDKQIDGVQYYGYTSDVTPSAWSNGNCLITDETPTMTSALYQEDGSAINYGGNITSVNLDEKIYYTFAEADDLNGSSYGNEIKPYKKDGVFTLNKIVFGNKCHSNTFGDDCSRNTFGNECQSNTFGNECSDNTFGNDCHNNSFENTCYSNTFGNECQSNTFGNECQSNTFGYNCDGNIFEYSCSHNTFGENCVDNTLGSDCGNITIGKGCRNNKFGMDCLRNSLGNYCSENTFGNGCWDNSFRVSASKNSSIVGYCKYNHFDDGCSYNVIWSTVNPSNVNSFRNININRGVCSREGVYNYINIETLNSEHEINVNQIDGIVSVGNILSIRYASLKSLRDNGQLIAGQQYRIIDYVTTTSQAGTKSAVHQFDLIVKADDNKTLNEKARAIQHEGDTYFANSDLNAWEVWYCFDNDSERFAWAGMPDNISSVSDGTRTFNYILPISYVVFKEKTYTLEVGKRTMIWGGPSVYVTLLEDGKSLYVEDNSSYITMSSILEVHLQHTGIIYRMIDEFNNDCPYDFKNILYSLDDAIVECEIQKYGSWFEGALTRDSTNDKVINNEQYYAWFYNVTAGPSGSGICYTKEERISVDSILYNDSGSEFSDVKLLSVISEVYTFGMGESADLSGNCRNNSIGVYITNSRQELNRITFGDYCQSNTFGNGCYSNTFGNHCNCNIFGENCSNNIFGENCSNNIFGDYCRNNTFGNSCSINIFGGNCDANTFGNGCYSNTFGNSCDNNSFGNECRSNSFRESASKNASIINNCQYNHFDDGCSYNVIWSTTNPSSANPLRNININRGVCGKSDAYNYINIETLNSEHEINVNQIDGIVSVGEILSIRHASLKSLRDNGQLIAGQQYRIIDYVTTTSQADTKSAEHQFDLIVTADDNKTFNEKARAIQHEGDTYFANSDLNAWEVWYCFDNDSERFAWAEQIQDETIQSVGLDSVKTFTFGGFISYITFASKVYNLVVGERTRLEVGPPVYVTLLEDGKSLYVEDSSKYITSSRPLTVHFKSSGVIYRMIDEFGNDCPYDFKNILFKRYKTTSTHEALVNDKSKIEDYIGYKPTTYHPENLPAGLTIISDDDYKWYYTFNALVDTVDLTLTKYATSNRIRTDFPDFPNNTIQTLNNIVFRCTDLYNNFFETGCYNMTCLITQNTVFCNAFGQYSRNNIFVCESGFNQNKIGDNFHSNIFIGSKLAHNDIGHYAQRNIIITNSNFIRNTIGVRFEDNTIIGVVQDNNIGHYAQQNIITNTTFVRNTIGVRFENNTIIGIVQDNIIGNYFGENKIDSYEEDNVGLIQTTIGVYCKSCTFKRILNCNIGQQCQCNTIERLLGSQIGMRFRYNTFKTSNDLNSSNRPYIQYCTFGDYVCFNNFYNSSTASSSNAIQNLRVQSNLQGTSETNPNHIEVPVASVSEIIVSKNSAGEIKIYNMADLIQ